MVLRAMVVVALCSCSPRYVVIDSKLEDVRPLARELICAPGFRQDMATAPPVVAIRPPEECIDRKLTQTGQTERIDELMATRCGVELAELERALVRAGYRVRAWQLNDEGTAPQLLIQLNAFEAVRLSGSITGWRRTYRLADENGAVGPPFTPTGREISALETLVRSRERAALEVGPFAAVIDATVIDAETHEAGWFFRSSSIEELRDDTHTSFLVREGLLGWEEARAIVTPRSAESETVRRFRLMRAVIDDLVASLHRRAECVAPAALAPVKVETESAQAHFEAAKAFRAKLQRPEEEAAYRRCVKVDGWYAECHFGLFEIFHADLRDENAVTACENYLKVATESAPPLHLATCRKYLRSVAGR